MARTDLVAVRALAASLILLGGCEADPGGRALLARPAEASIRFSDYQPDRPFQPVAAGLLARTVFSEQIASGVRVEVRELLVGPKQTTARHVLPAAALLDVRTAVAATITRGDGKPSALAAGATLRIVEGEAIVIENHGEEPLVVTAYLFSAR
jgi:hypothetical protein